MALPRTRIRTSVILGAIVALLVTMLGGVVTAGSASAATITALTMTDTNITLSETDTRTLEGTAPSGTASTHLTVTFGTGSAAYTVDGGSSVALTSEVASAPITVNDGLTTVVVTHSEGGVDTVFTVYVFKVRALSGIEVEGGTLSPAFDPAVFSYSVEVPYSATTARIRANWDTSTTANATEFQYCIDTGATGVTQTPNEWATVTGLSVGTNTRNLLLRTNTPQGWVGGCTSGSPQRYTVRIVRADAFTSSTLSAVSLTDTNVSLSSASAPYSFTGTAASGSTQTHVTASFSTGTASYAVDGVSAGSLTSGSASAAIALNDGLTTITVTHVGAATTTYTLYVFKVRALSGIEVEGGTLSPAFDPAVFSYEVVLPNAAEQTRIRADWDTSTTANATEFQYCIDTGFSGVTQTPGDWSGYGNLSVGTNTRNLLLRTNTPQGWVGGCTSGSPQRYTVRIVRASAFSSIGGVTTSAPPVETPVTAGTTITATPISVSGTPAPTVTYDWEAAETPTSEFAVVATTASAAWAPDNTVAGKYLRVVAEAKNGVSVDASATSAVFGPITGVAEAPSISGVSVSGTPRSGSTLTASVTSAGYPTPTLSYSWEKAVSSSGTFSAISGATSSTYTPTAADVGSVIRVTVTAQNTSGADATSSSAATTAVVAAPVDSSTSAGGSSSSTVSSPGVQSLATSLPGEGRGSTAGTAVVLVSGTPAVVETQQDSARGTWTVSGSGFTIAFAPQGVSSTGELMSVTEFQAPQGGYVEVTGTGYRPGTTVNAFLLADSARVGATRDRLPSIAVGSADVLSDGTFLLRADVPQQTDPGAYVLQVNGAAPDTAVRSVNMGMDVTSGLGGARSLVTAASAFFQGRSADLSRDGARKLRTMIARVPADCTDLRADVMAVSLGRASIRANQRIATSRAREALSFLRDRGVSGATTVTMFTSANVPKSERKDLQRSSKGRPLTTIRLSCALPGTSS